jgi:hypothetical protein
LKSKKYWTENKIELSVDGGLEEQRREIPASIQGHRES